MRRSHPVIFRRGFIDAVAVATVAGAVLACSDDDVVAPIAVPPGDVAGAEAGEPPGEAPDAGVTAPPEPPLPTVLAERVSALLERDCVECHGGGAALGGLGDIPALTTLQSSGQIVPGASAASPLIALLQDEPHGISSRSWLSVGEIALVARLIDELGALEQAPCEPLPFTSRDAELAAMLADASSLSADVRPFTRYFGMTHASNAGACGAALDRERHALFALINGVSTAPEIGTPRAVDDRGLIFRIDIRDYAWDRPIDLEDDSVVDFDDGWLAIVAAAGDLAPPFDGPEADELERLTGARVPHLPVHVFVDAASQDDLYYTLTGQSASIDSTQVRLGIDLFQAIDSGDVVRAGFVSRDRNGDDLMALRFDQTGLTPLAYWMLAIDPGNRGESIFSDPLGVPRDGSQHIFHLQNGMLGFGAGDPEGARSSPAQQRCSTCPTTRANLVAAGCRGCHHAGLLPLEDQIRPFVEDNEVIYDSETFAATLEQYPSPTELDPVLEADTAIYLTALDRAGVPRNAPDPVSAVYFDFERPLTVARTAAELGVTRAELESKLAELDGPLQILAIENGRVARTDFIAGYRSALCLLLGSAQNRPEGCAPLF